MTQTMYQNNIENYFISWDEIHHDTSVLALRLADAGWQQIIALTEGGIGPAASIARDLKIPMINALSVRDPAVQHDLTFLQEHIDKQLKTLFIDDLVATGKTARAAKAAFPQAHFVAMYAKPSGRPHVDDFVNEIDQDCWIHFPWDVLTSEGKG